MSFIVKYGLKLQLMLLKTYNTTNVVVQYYKGSLTVPLHILLVMNNAETIVQYDSRVSSTAFMLTMIITILFDLHQHTTMHMIQVKCNRHCACCTGQKWLPL